MNVLGFDFPDALHYHVEHQVWARADADGRFTVGITSLGIRLAGEIYMCRPKGVGQAVEQGRSVAVVELAKAIVSVKSPLSGTVVEVNPALAERPELVHGDPYGAGWIARIEASAWAADRAALVQGEPVAEAMRHHAWLNNLGSSS
jgi:glycine cleavage system H protein